MGAPLFAHALEGVEQEPELALAADQRSLQCGDAALLARHRAACPHHRERLDGLDLPLGQDRRACHVLDRLPGQLFRQGAQDHLTGLGILLETRRHIDDVAGDDQPFRTAGHGSTAVDADSDG